MIETLIGYPLEMAMCLIPQEEKEQLQIVDVFAREQHVTDPERTPRIVRVTGHVVYVAYFRDGLPGMKEQLNG